MDDSKKKSEKISTWRSNKDRTNVLMLYTKRVRHFTKYKINSVDIFLETTRFWMGNSVIYSLRTT